MLSLSLFFGYHDSAVTVANSQKVLLHLEAERFFRRKHCVVTPKEMDALVSAALHYLGYDIDSVERVYVCHLRNQLPTDRITVNGRSFEPIIVYHHECHIGTVLDHGFQETLIVVADGGSEDGATSVYYYDAAGQISTVENLDETAANGKFYGSLTMLVIDPDFMKAHGWYSGKTMGLSAYGSYRDDFEKLLREHTPKMLWGNELDVAASRKLFGISENYDRPWLDEGRKDLAHTGQQYWTSVFLERLAAHRSVSRNIVMVGGCALNVLLNSSLVGSGLFDEVHVGPASGDCGQSLGAILYHEREVRCDWPYLGRGFGEVEEYPTELVDDLLSGNIVAWYQGRAEIGPRALGHRSLLGLPNSVEQRDRMNRLKGREPYRPVAPVIPVEHLTELFETTQRSPYMSFAPVAREVCQRLAPAIVHADGTSRLQTLAASENPILHRALTEIGEETGAPILMNTSFNFAGEAIVDTPDDAVRNFRSSGADTLYINGERICR